MGTRTPSVRAPLVAGGVRLLPATSGGRWRAPVGRWPQGLTSNRSRLGLLGGAAPSRTFPVLPSAVCVIRGMELWYPCTVVRDVRIDQAVPVRPNRAATGGGSPYDSGDQEGHRRVAPPPGGARTVAVALPLERSFPCCAMAAHRNGAGSLRSFGGWVWSPSTLCGRPSAWRPADPEQPGPPYDPGHP
jgi:hypothetical protein